MIVKLLMIDNQPEGDDFIEDPSWDDIEEALNLMDGSYRTYLGLYKEEEPTEGDFLMVGGGVDKEQFVCSYFNEGEEYYVLNEQEKDPETVVNVPVGQMGAKKKKYVNPKGNILDAIKHFYETGDMDPEVKWQKI